MTESTSALSAATNGAGPGTPVEVERAELDGSGAVAAILWLNRPDSLNAIDWPMVAALEDALNVADSDPTVRTILISGRGRAFSAGGDLKSYVTLQRSAVEFPRFMRDLHRTFGSIRSLGKPTVALVNGITAAGGLELILACDFAYAAASAQIGDAHLNYGQMGGGGVLALLPRMLPPARARELFFSAELLPAEEALEWGLVNRVVPDDQLLDAGLKFARKVAGKSAASVANAKYVMNVGLADGTGLEGALRLERERNAFYCLNLPDSSEGLAAFAEKRPPRFADS